MRRWIPVVLALAGLVGVVGSAAAASGPGPAGPAPAKTTVPPSSVPPIGGVPPPPTVAPPTSAWVTTVATGPPTTIVTGALPTVAPEATTAPPAGAPSAGFDGLTFLTDVYAAVNSDPLTIIDVAEGATIINSPADLWLAHLLTVSMTNLVHQGR